LANWGLELGAGTGTRLPPFLNWSWLAMAVNGMDTTAASGQKGEQNNAEQTQWPFIQAFPFSGHEPHRVIFAYYWEQPLPWFQFHFCRGIERKWPKFKKKYILS
jgi:hypothetical protein